MDSPAKLQLQPDADSRESPSGGGSLLDLQAAASRVLIEGRDVRAAVESLVRLICEYKGWDYGALWLWEPPSKGLVLSSHWSRPNAGVEPFFEACRGAVFVKGQGILGRVFENGQEVWVIDDIRSDVSRAMPPSAEIKPSGSVTIAAKKAGLKSCVVLPVRAGGEMLGVIEFYSRSIKVRDPDFPRTITHVSDGIALSVLRWRAERSLEDEQRRAASAMKMAAVGHLAGGVGHEMGTPLFTIQAAAVEIESVVAEASAAGIPDHLKPAIAELTRISKVVEAQASWMGRTLTALHSLAREDRGARAFEKVAAIELLRDAQALCGKLFEERGVALEVCLPAQSIDVECQRGPTLQVIMGLLQNALDAVRAVKDGRTLQVRLSAGLSPDGSVFFECSDNGIGIADDLQPHIGDPFVTTKAPDGGMGMTLTMARGILKEHGGSLSFNSALGRGTTFKIELPSRAQKVA